jgi:histidinol-phosphate phosphatase family protein
MSLKQDLKFHNTLFLDRDGTINRRIVNGYVGSEDNFEFLPGVLEALYKANTRFEHIFIVTNQQGIGKEIITEEEVRQVHQYMMSQIVKNGGRIDQIYVCPHLSVFNPLCRKPNPGMAIQAQEDFPEIDFASSIMVGDADSDIEFGNNLGMYTVQVRENHHPLVSEPDTVVNSLLEFMNMVV